jgi:hypothetical protein
VEKNMTIQELENLPKNSIIHVERIINIFGYASIEWFVGIPHFIQYQGWACYLLAFKGELYKGKPLQLQLLLSDIITHIPPQDLVKYLAYLTDAGADYLKNLSNKENLNNVLTHLPTVQEL